PGCDHAGAGATAIPWARRHDACSAPAYAGHPAAPGVRAFDDGRAGLQAAGPCAAPACAFRGIRPLGKMAFAAADLRVMSVPRRGLPTRTGGPHSHAPG